MYSAIVSSMTMMSAGYERLLRRSDFLGMSATQVEKSVYSVPGRSSVVFNVFSGSSMLIRPYVS